MNGKLYLDVPYVEKDAVKNLGAKWDPSLKKWYYKGPVENYIKFAKWIAGDQEETIIAHEYVYLLETDQNCFRCGNPTRVVGLGIGEHTYLYREDGRFEMETVENRISFEPLFLAWVESENDIPPALLEYMKKNYHVRTGISQKAGPCFANYCEHCGVIQGNWHLFCEDSPLSPMILDGPELRERLRKVKIYSIGIDEDLVLDWSFGFGSNNDLYFKYCPIEELILPPSKDEFISYADLYRGCNL